MTSLNVANSSFSLDHLAVFGVSMYMLTRVPSHSVIFDTYQPFNGLYTIVPVFLLLLFLGSGGCFQLTLDVTLICLRGVNFLLFTLV